MRAEDDATTVDRRRVMNNSNANGITTRPRGSIRELVTYFLRLGTTGFGGPVALVGLMERDLVTDRGWLTREEMREVIAISQSLPGPLAIQVGIFISYLRCGFWGAWAGGWAFILPNFLMVAALGALYVHFGGLSWMTAIFYGVSPAVIALILHSCWRLAKLGMEDRFQWLIAAVAFAITVALEAEVALLFIGAGIAGILYYGSLFRATPPEALAAFAAPVVDRHDADSERRHPCQAAGVLPEGRQPDVRFRPGHRAIPGEGPGAGDGLDRSAPVPGRGRDRHAEPRPGGDHRDLRRLPGGRLLGLAGLHHRHLPAVVPADPDRGTDPAPPSRQRQRAGLHQGRLCGGDRHHPRRLRSARAHRHRRLADRADRRRRVSPSCSGSR